MFYLFAHKKFCFFIWIFSVLIYAEGDKQDTSKYYFNWYQKTDFLIRDKFVQRIKNVDFDDKNRNESKSEYDLKYSGYKTIVVGLGSQDNFDLHQTLNLDVKGQISKEFYIRAHLSDQDVPLQTQGYTSTLKEIDQVFVEIYSSKYGILLGDYIINFGKKNIEKLYLKAQGIQVYSNFNQVFQKGGVAISEGLYHSSRFEGEQGKQTHYFLVGRNNESFISVFKGTEKIWKNGILLKRNKDYLMYYGEGRIDFLQNLLMSPEDIFLAEYQYTLKDYPNTLFYNTIEDTIGSIQWSLRGVLSMDDLNPIGSFSLSEEDVRNLREVGDSMNNILNQDTIKVLFPQRRGFYTVDLKLKNDTRTLLFNNSFYFSDNDKNLFSNLDDEDNFGHGLDVKFKYELGKTIKNGGWGFWKLDTEINYRNKNFESFNPIVEDYFFVERWNINSSFIEKNYYKHLLDLSNNFISSFRLGLLSGYYYGILKDSLFVQSYFISPYFILGKNEEFTVQFFKTQNKFLLDTVNQIIEYSRLESKLNWNSNFFSPYVKSLYKLSEESGEILSIEKDFLTKIKLFEKFRSIDLVLDGRYYNRKFRDLKILKDSLSEKSFSIFLSLYRIGIWNTDILISFQRVDLYSQSLAGFQSSKFILIKWGNRFSDYKQGYQFKINYKFNPTEENTLRPKFVRVNNGNGEYVCDTSKILIFTHCVLADEVGGDFRLDGFERDSIGIKVTNVSLLGDFSLNQIWFKNRNWGSFFNSLAFYFNFDIRTKSDSQNIFFPLILEEEINREFEGRRFLNPVLVWNNIKIERIVRVEWSDLYEYSFFDLARTSQFKQNVSFSERIHDFWNLSLSHYFSRQRFIFSSAENQVERFNQLWAFQIDIAFLFTHIWTWKSTFIYDVSRGSENSLFYRLLSYTLKNRLERLIGEKNKFSLEYSLHLRFGKGNQSILNGSLGFSKGLTQRLNVTFDFDINEYFTGSFQYLLRKELNQSSLIQKFFVEGKAFF